jgi:hypothetical protein
MNSRVGKAKLKWSELCRLCTNFAAQRYRATSRCNGDRQNIRVSDGRVFFLMRANAGGRSICTGVGPLNGLTEAGLLPPD